MDDKAINFLISSVNNNPIDEIYIPIKLHPNIIDIIKIKYTLQINKYLNTPNIPNFNTIPANTILREDAIRIVNKRKRYKTKPS